jgi:hypothetical protein
VIPGTYDESVGFCCDGGCISSDLGNCGGCGIVCGAESVCNEDLWEGCEPSADCATSPSEAPCRLDGGLPGNCCQHTCVDVDSDPRNCDYCGIIVPLGQTCVGATFAPVCMDAGCPPGSWCDPNDGECLVSAPCSASRQGESCLMDGGLGICCGDTCAPFFQVCGNGPGCDLCDAGQECDYVCVAPTSTVADCQFGPNLEGMLCGQQCVNFWEDPRNCGGCGNVCPSGVCSSQPLTCLPQAPTDDCLGRCGPSAICFEGTCMESDCASILVPFCLAENGTIGLCCGHACAHPLDDPENCGGCANACPPGQACVDGACSGFAGCGPGQMYGFCGPDGGSSACCPSAGCTDLMTDRLNCGRCGSSCSEVLNCVDGFCVVPQDAGIGSH